MDLLSVLSLDRCQLLASKSLVTRYSLLAGLLFGDAILGGGQIKVAFSVVDALAWQECQLSGLILNGKTMLYLARSNGTALHDQTPRPVGPAAARFGWTIHPAA